MSDAIYATLGSVSSATLRTEDLIPAFIDALDSVKDALSTSGNPENAKAVAALDSLLGKIERRSAKAGYFESDRAQDDLESLTQELEAFAPPLTYFGSHEGDGADFGFWISWDSISEAEHSGELIRVNAGDEWPESAADAEYVLEVTDHGNATLFSALTKAEIWSIV